MGIMVPRAKLGVEGQALPGARVGTDSGGAFDSGAAAINKAAQGIFAQEKEKADMIAFLAADLEVAKASSRLEIKYKGERLGKDAVGAAPDAGAEFDKEVAKVSAGLSPNQQAMLAKSTHQRKISLNQVLEHHASSEMTKYKMQVTDSYITEAQTEAASAASMYKPGDVIATSMADQSIATAVMRQEAAISQFALDHGLGELWLKNKLISARSTTHRAVIEVMLSNGNDLMARDYAALHGDDIRGKEDIVAINKSLKEGNLRGESQRNHDKIMVSADTWEDRYKAAKDVADPTIRAATVQELDNSFAREKRVEKDRGDNAFIGAAAEAEKAGTTRVIDPSIWAGFTPAERTAIEARLEHVKKGTEPVTDSRLWTEFVLTPASEVAKITEADLMKKYRGALDNSHYDRAVAVVAAAREAVGKGPDALSSMQSDSDLVRNAWLGYTKNPAMKDLNDEETFRFMRFSDAASVAVQRYELSRGKKATDEEKQAVVKKVLADEVFIKRPWYASDVKVPTKLIDEGEGEGAYVKMQDIPPKRREGLVNWARSVGVIPQNVPQSQAELFLGRRLERADAAGQLGASDEAIRRLLEDGPKMAPVRPQTARGIIKRN